MSKFIFLFVMLISVAMQVNSQPKAKEPKEKRIHIYFFDHSYEEDLSKIIFTRATGRIVNKDGFILPGRF